MALLLCSFFVFFFSYSILPFYSFFFGIYSFYKKTSNFLTTKLKKEVKENVPTQSVSLNPYDYRSLLFFFFLLLITNKFSQNDIFFSSNFSYVNFFFRVDFFLFFLIFFIFLIFNFFFKHKIITNDYQTIFLLPSATIVHYLILTTNFVVFTFLIETFSYFFFFQFLAIYSHRNKSGKKKKGIDLLLFYY